jgi:hypothetical protein
MIGRLDYIVALLREQELKYYKPTHDMLKRLFEGLALEKEEKPIYLEKNTVRMTKEEWNREKGKVSFEKYHDAIKAKSKYQQTFSNFLDCIIKIVPTFGNPYFKIEINEVELETIKRKFE